MQNKFESLRPWLKDILNTIKKDIKTDYLPGDKVFYKAHFGGRPMNRLTNEEIFDAFEKELLAGNESCDEWVVNRWVFKHGDLYNHFADRLSKIRPDFNELKELSEAESSQVLAGTESFNAIDTYLFSVLNGVVFPASVFESMRKKALDAKAAEESEAASQSSKESLEQIVERQQRDFARLQEKSETKLAGVMRKYTTDVEALKKQIRSLQQQLLQK